MCLDLPSVLCGQGHIRKVLNSPELAESFACIGWKVAAIDINIFRFRHIWRYIFLLSANLLAGLILETQKGVNSEQAIGNWLSLLPGSWGSFHAGTPRLQLQFSWRWWFKVLTPNLAFFTLDTTTAPHLSLRCTLQTGNFSMQFVCTTQCAEHAMQTDIIHTQWQL